MSEVKEPKASILASLLAGCMVLLVLGGATLWGLEWWVDRAAWFVDPSWYRLEEGERVSLGCQRFRPITFSRQPAPGVTRILALGGSTVFGFPSRPVGDQPLTENVHGVIGVVQKALDSEWPRQFEVVNLGINGGGIVDTERLLRRAEAWGASALIVYDGNNEFLPVPSQFSAGLWGYALYRQLSVALPRPTTSPGYVGPAAHGSPAHKKAILSLFEDKLNAVIDLGLSAALPVVVSTQAVNRIDVDPNWSTSGDEQHLAVSRTLSETQLTRAMEASPTSADLLWERGRREVDSEMDWLQAAVDHDGLQLRAGSEINEIIRHVGRREGVTLIDAAAVVADTEHVGGLFYDWVHPTPKGAEIIGRLLLEGLAQAEVIPFTPQHVEQTRPPQDDLDEGVLRSARSWLQWACVRQHDPEVRLTAARSLLDSLGSETSEAVASERDAILNVISSWGTRADISDEYRERLSQLHPCMGLQLQR